MLGSVIDDRPMIVVMATKDSIKEGIHCGNIAKAIAKKIGGGGGGSPLVAQAGGKDPEQLSGALNVTEDIIRSSLD